jgi:integrase
MSITSSRYQQGTIERATRAKGPDVWIFRWREVRGDQRIQRKRVVGTVTKYKTKSAALKAVENLRTQINSGQDRVGQMTVSELWGHFQEHELWSEERDRSPTTIDVYLHNMKSIIIPHWGEKFLPDIIGAEVEEWLSGLMDKSKPPKPYMPATKSKLRNQMSALFSHALRWRKMTGNHPMEYVRQSPKRTKLPVILSLAEMQNLISHVADPLVRTAILVAASTGLRRSEIRGLRWSDFDFSNLWLNLSRGIVGNYTTKLKTEASRKGIPFSQDLANALVEWRGQSLYRADEDWVFASVQRNGEVPVWFDILVARHLHPAAKAAGIKKAVSWSTFRHSFASLLAEKGEKIKVVQELMRHSKSSTTLDIYQQAYPDSKRLAQNHIQSLFVVPRAS